MDKTDSYYSAALHQVREICICTPKMQKQDIWIKEEKRLTAAAYRNGTVKPYKIKPHIKKYFKTVTNCIR